MTATPITEEHEGVLVVRDDLFPGGTKARFLPTLFEDANEIVYASSAQGGAQYSLAYVANKLGKRATIFSPARKVPHPRQLEACRFGAQVIPVKPGYLSLCIARALKYCEETGAKLAPFGMSSGGCIEIIADAARLINCKPKQVWCAAGSGTLAQALRRAWPAAEHHVVQVGQPLTSEEVSGAIIHKHPKEYGWAAPPTTSPFPSDPHYEAKAWEVCQAERSRTGLVLFWNVVGPAVSLRESYSTPFPPLS
jgi:Pyridoxal-phosphate dependent enzyme